MLELIFVLVFYVIVVVSALFLGFMLSLILVSVLNEIIKRGKRQ